MSVLQNAIHIADLLTKLFIAAAVVGLFVVVMLLPDPLAAPVIQRVKSRVDVSIKNGELNVELRTTQAGQTAAELASVQDAIQSAFNTVEDGSVKGKLADAKKWVIHQRERVEDNIAATTQRAQATARPAETPAQVPEGWVYAGLAISNRIAVPSSTVSIEGLSEKTSVDDIAAVTVRRPVALVSEIGTERGDISEIGAASTEDTYFLQPGGPSLKVLEVKRLPTIGSGMMVWLKLKPTKGWVVKTSKAPA